MTDIAQRPVRLLDRQGRLIATITVPDELLDQSETISRRGQIFIRKTHTTYLIASCLVLPD